MKNNKIKRVTYWYNSLTGNVEWIVDYKSGTRRMYKKNKLPKTIQKWLGEDSVKMVKATDAESTHWHIETYEEK